MAECHPDQLAHGYGKCKRCYQRDWLRNARVRAERKATAPKGPGKQQGTVYPQAIVRGLPKGWGSLV